MKVEQTIQKISLIFLFVIGAVNIVGYLMLINGYSLNIANAAKKITEIPFILTAAVYGFVSLKLSLATPGKKQPISNIIFLLIVIGLFAALIYLNLFIPDR